VAGANTSFVNRVLSGVRAASEAWGLPVLGGHTQLGAPAALAVTALGRTSAPLRAGGARVGDEVRLVADLGGGWRPRYTGAQWDSTSSRGAAELRALAGAFGDGTTSGRLPRPAAAKDVSMAGAIGTLAMLAEAGGCGALLDVAAVPRPSGTSAGDWLTCFPGWAMVTADRPTIRVVPDGPVSGLPATSARCAELVAGAGVGLRWPDGEVTVAVSGGATGLGIA
jgi:selenophosphate synthetase-related protein